MRTLKLASVAGAVLLVGSMIGFAQAEPSFSIVNGGGQIEVTTGAGDTIAFTVRGEESTVGQVQYVDREGGTGQNQTVQHGTPNCLDVQGNMAVFAVDWNGGGVSTIFVEDLGSGAGSDTVTIVPGVSDCDEDEPDDREDLARGNVTVQDNETG